MDMYVGVANQFMSLFLLTIKGNSSRYPVATEHGPGFIAPGRIWLQSITDPKKHEMCLRTVYFKITRSNYY